MQYFGETSKNDKMIFVPFQGKPFNIIVIQVYTSTTDAEEAKVDWFYEDYKNLLEITPKKDVLFIIGCFGFFGHGPGKIIVH